MAEPKGDSLTSGVLMLADQSLTYWLCTETVHCLLVESVSQLLQFLVHLLHAVFSEILHLHSRLPGITLTVKVLVVYLNLVRETEIGITFRTM